MIPVIKIRSTKEQFRFNVATDTICSLCGDQSQCAGCAIREMRSATAEVHRKAAAHMDCCCMQPPEIDPGLLERYSVAFKDIRSCVGVLGLLALPEAERDLLKSTTELEEKVPLLESIAVRLMSSDRAHSRL